MKPLVYLAAVVLLVSGCSLFDFNSTSEDADDVVVLEEGHQQALPSFNATLRFVEKQADSRCPLDVDCIWEGEATILLDLRLPDTPPTLFTMTGHVGPDGGGRVAADTLGLHFTLERLDPYPREGVDDDGPSTATIRVASDE